MFRFFSARPVAVAGVIRAQIPVVGARGSRSDVGARDRTGALAGRAIGRARIAQLVSVHDAVAADGAGPQDERRQRRRPRADAMGDHIDRVGAVDEHATFAVQDLQDVRTDARVVADRRAGVVGVHAVHERRTVRERWGRQ